MTTKTDSSKDSKTIIGCENLNCFYGKYQACKNVNFQIHQGDYLCIVGSNGSGKSTLVKTILGLHKNYTGSIIRDKNTALGYLPQQNPVQKDFPASVFEVVLSGRLSSKKLFSFYNKEDKKIALEKMEKLGITKLKNVSFRELSGGQQQRVLLARSLCSAKDMLILDEPVTGLDPTVTDELYALIKELNTKDNLTVIMVSHDIHRATSQASHILHMNKEPLFFGTSKDYEKTQYFQNLSHVEVCGTHCGACCCDAHCTASHMNFESHHHEKDEHHHNMEEK